MRLRSFLLADAVSLGEAGKIYVHGGGIVRLTVESFPWTQPQIDVLLRLERTTEEIGSDHEVVIRLVNQGGETMAELRANYRVPKPPDPDTPLTMNMAGGFTGVPFPEPGPYAVLALVDGVEIDRLPLHIDTMTANEEAESR